jgi:hypothetical protein
MRSSRITVALKVNNTLYKFFSILPSQKDASLFIHQHIKDERSPLTVGTKSLTKIPSVEYFKDIPATQHSDGSTVHLSLHPNRIYLKRRGKKGATEHLVEEAEPQKFNKHDWRLICVLTSPPISHMPILNKNNCNQIVIFEWESKICPQISILEFKQGIDWKNKVSTLEKVEKYHIIESDGVHPTIALQLRKTNGESGVWRPCCSVFGRVLKKNNQL